MGNWNKVYKPLWLHKVLKMLKILYAWIVIQNKVSIKQEQSYSVLAIKTVCRCLAQLIVPWKTNSRLELDLLSDFSFVCFFASQFYVVQIIALFSPNFIVNLSSSYLIIAFSSNLRLRLSLRRRFVTSTTSAITSCITTSYYCDLLVIVHDDIIKIK